MKAQTPIPPPIAARIRGTTTPPSLPEVRAIYPKDQNPAQAMTFKVAISFDIGSSNLRDGPGSSS
jgi:hypothetical protein